MADLIKTTAQNLGHQLPPNDASSLVTDFLAGKSPRTLKTYRQDLDDFRRFLGAGRVEDAARALISLSSGEANALGIRYKNSLIERSETGDR